MLYEIMKHINNFFLTGELYSQTFTIKNGKISLSSMQDGDYYLVLHSKYNDGVYKYPSDELKDETFTGEVAILAPPSAFIALCEEITAYNEKTATLSPFQSESFGGYSYSRAMNANGTFQSWQDAYRPRLNTWRKL